MLRRRDWLLLFIADPEGPFSTDQIRVMKGMFLLSKQRCDALQSLYTFEPYDYGPFDKHVYYDLDRLETEGLIVSEPVPHTNRRTFRLTRRGRERVEDLETVVPRAARVAVTEVKELVTSMGFMPLLRYVYEKYPEYAARSVVEH